MKAHNGSVFGLPISGDGLKALGKVVVFSVAAGVAWAQFRELIQIVESHGKKLDQIVERLTSTEKTAGEIKAEFAVRVEGAKMDHARYDRFIEEHTGHRTGSP